MATGTYWRHAFKNIHGEECVGVERFRTRAAAEAALATRIARDTSRPRLTRHLYVVESQERP